MFFLGLFLFAQTVLAEPRATVWARNPASIQKIFPANKYKMLNASAERAQWEKNGWIPAKKRNAIFHKLKMELMLLGWDELDKDILVMTAKVASAELLKKNYPNFPLGTLRSLKREIKELNESKK